MSGKQRDVLMYRRIALTCLLISIVLCSFSSILSFAKLTFMTRIFLYPGVILLISFIVISYIFWRCPRCKKRLPMRFNYKKDVDEILCPYCNMNFLYDKVDEKNPKEGGHG